MRVKWKWWIKSNSEDDGETMNIWRGMMINSNQNMKWSYINTKCNDGRDNDPDPLRKGHSSHSLTKDMMKWIQRKKILKSSHTTSHQQTCLLKWPLDINIHAQLWRILCTYTHVLIFLFFSYFFFIFPDFFFLHIYKCIYPKHEQNKLQRW